MTKQQALCIVSVYVRSCATSRRIAEMFPGIGPSDGRCKVRRAAEVLGIDMGPLELAADRTIEFRRQLFDKTEQCAGRLFQRIVGEPMPTWREVVTLGIPKPKKKRPTKS